jgi:hypothetical protein
MKILEYNDVDPLQVLNLTLLALDFPLTPEHAAHIRRTDPRLFPVSRSTRWKTMMWSEWQESFACR